MRFLAYSVLAYLTFPLSFLLGSRVADALWPNNSLLLMVGFIAICLTLLLLFAVWRIELFFRAKSKYGDAPKELRTVATIQNDPFQSAIMTALEEDPGELRTLNEISTKANVHPDDAFRILTDLNKAGFVYAGPSVDGASTWRIRTDNWNKARDKYSEWKLLAQASSDKNR